MENKADLDWVAQFDSGPSARPPRNRATTAAVGTLLGGGALTAIALLVAALTRPAAEEAGLRPTRTPTAAPVPSVVQTATEQPSLLPSGCGGLYSESMHLTLGQLGFELDSQYSGEWHSGSADAELRELLEDARLDCYWSDGDAALLTRVAEVGDQHEALAIERLGELAFTPVVEHGGVRYFRENHTATGATGESHFFREGIWFATHWLDHGQYGYTADMVRSVFG